MEVLTGVGARELASQASLPGQVNRGRKTSLMAALRAQECGTYHAGAQPIGRRVQGVQRPLKLSLRGAGDPGQGGTTISMGRENERFRGPEKAWLLLVSGLIMRGR